MLTGVVGVTGEFHADDSAFAQHRPNEVQDVDAALYGLRCVAMAAMEQAIWPLMGLHVVTPMLTLRYITDDLGMELALLAAEGVHDPVTMPFSTPWTDVPSPELERNTLRFYWRNRADTTVEHWDLNLAVVVDGIAVGMCSVAAAHEADHRHSCCRRLS